VTIRCARCGRVIGSYREIVYGGEYGDDYCDYGEPEWEENYGGDFDGDSYCEDCYGGLEDAGEED
jgi:hypothetical protein